MRINVTSYRGFCKEHDNNLFEIIEKDNESDEINPKIFK